MLTQRRSWLADFLLLFVFAAALIWPLYKTKYLDLWHSIESTFIADARFLSDHWPHPNWQPNWYCGTRTDYIYPPALRYGTAVLAHYYPGMLPVRAYHLYIAFFYCLGIAAVYLLVRQGSGSRAAGSLAALATALVSPVYLIFSHLRHDPPFLMPYRLNVLVRYGEGPHISSLGWILLALFFTWRAMEKWRPASLVAAAFSCAMVVANNFYGATALAFLFPILVWSIYITHLDRTIWWRALVIPVLAYGLTAFWLVPSYLRITLDNMQFVSSEGNLWSRWVALAYIVVFLLLSDYLIRGRRQDAWLLFVVGSLGIFSINVIGNHFLNFRIIGEPSRLMPELDVLLIFLGVEMFRRFWSMPSLKPGARNAAICVALALLLASSWNYLRQAHGMFIPDPNHTERVEHELQDWVARNLPGSRTLAGGSVRFWYNVWNDLPQVGGGSEQGVLNPRVLPPQWQIFMGPEADLSTMWLQVMGADAVVVNDKTSREHYKDYLFPDKFKGVLPVLHDNGRGDTIYGVPRRFRSLARVVDRARFDGLPSIPGNGELRELQAWIEVVEHGAIAEAPMQWHGTDAFEITATLGEAQSIWIQESFDANWRAYANGVPVPIRQDKLGFMIIDVPAGRHDIRFTFPTPFSNIVGRVVTALTLLACIGLVSLGRKK